MFQMEFNEKTVFVLNHTNSFNELCQDEILLESGTKSSLKTVFRKSFWFNTVDAVLQYSRIVFDLFSQSKPISVVTFDNEEKIHSIWLDEDQNLQALWSIFAHEGPPSTSSMDQSCATLMPGLDAACSMLQMLKNSQKEHTSLSDNTGRVIFISRSSRPYIDNWISLILSTLEKPVTSPGYAPVTASEWLFIDLTTSAHSGFSFPERIEQPALLSPMLSHRFFYHELSANGTDVYRGLMRLIETHFGLASTLVQDIPMKEEANTSSSSSMYGVELLHQAEAHDALRLVGLADRLTVRMEPSNSEDEVSPLVLSTLQRPNSGFSRTLGIKWVTPKSADSSLLRYSSAAYRVTLADVSNRASVCLAQFVLGGRSVALAHRLPVKWPALPDDANMHNMINPNEALLLTCHGSVMYLHVLATIFPLAHPPMVSIAGYPDSSDLRVRAFIDQIIRPSRLAPASAHQSFTVSPRERAQLHLERSTRYWPLLNSATLLGNNKVAVPLFEHLPKEFLEPNELVACKVAVDRLVDSIKQNVSLTDSRKGLGKRSATSLPVAPSVQAEAVALALELDHMLSVYADVSSEHQEVRQHWRAAAGLVNTSGDCVSLSRATKCENISSLGLSDLITLARSLASQAPDQPSSNILPEVFVKSITNLKFLCEDLRRSGASESVKFESMCQPKTDNGHSKPEFTFTLESVNPSAFLNLLQAKPGRSRQPKRELAGVATADAKGMCQLYRALREKEREKAAT